MSDAEIAAILMNRFASDGVFATQPSLDILREGGMQFERVSGVLEATTKMTTKAPCFELLEFHDRSRAMRLSDRDGGEGTAWVALPPPVGIVSRLERLTT